MKELSTVYQQAKKFVSHLKVVNDAAERGIKLITDFTAILTDSPLQPAGLLQAAEQHKQYFAAGMPRLTRLLQTLEKSSAKFKQWS